MLRPGKKALHTIKPKIYRKGIMALGPQAVDPAPDQRICDFTSALVVEPIHELSKAPLVRAPHGVGKLTFMYLEMQGLGPPSHRAGIRSRYAVQCKPFGGASGAEAN